MIRHLYFRHLIRSPSSIRSKTIVTAVTAQASIAEWILYFKLMVCGMFGKIGAEIFEKHDKKTLLMISCVN